jgi:gliding motility-associated-like protein
MLKNRISLLNLCIFLFAISQFNAQMNVSIADGNVNTCNGTLFDTGGQGGTGYSNNENHTLTICPDNPNDVISLVFITFNLDNTNTATGGGNNQDRITIYDGNSTAATSLGSYTGNQLQGTIVTCTSLNTSGCITLTFQSNNTGTGIFAATITCTTPCQRPTAVATSNPGSTALVCVNDVITFNGSASYAQAGFSIVQYIWDYADGTGDTLTTPNSSHSYNNPGEYVVQLYVIDDNGCINSNVVDIQILVATEPIFTPLINDQTICLGETANFQAFPDQYSQTWTGMPDGNLGGPQYVPDQVGQCFSTNLTFQQFAPGQTLTNINDLQSLCIDFEHSFMGDLVVSINCPSGQSVILHQQGGGGTNLGDPNQADDPNLPGIGWNYCWAPTATNGTWVQNSQSGATPNVVPNSSGSTSLAPGTYQSLNPMSALVGCQLNGTWSIEFCDLWGSDDGFVFGWSIDFNPAIIPNVTVFTPLIGLGCDSSFWSGPNISNPSPNCNSMQIVPSALGTFNYTYTVMNNHGCTKDTTVTLTVTPGPEANAGDDIAACVGDAVQLNGGVENLIPTPPCLFTLNMEDSFGDGWNGASLTLVVNGVPTTQTIATGSSGTYTFTLNQGSTLSLNYTGGTWESEVSYEIVDCNGAVIFAAGPFPPTGNNIFNYTYSNSPDYVYAWSPTTGLSDPNIANPTLTVANTTTYTLTVYENGHPLCGSTDQVTVNVVCGTCQPAQTVVTNITCNGDNNGEVAITPVGIDGPPFIIQLLNSTGTTVLQEDNNVMTSTNFSNLAAGSYIIRSIDTTGCQADANISITQPPPITIIASNDTLICIGGNAQITASASGGNGAPYTYSWSNAAITGSSQTVSPTVQTTYTVSAADQLGCTTVDELIVVNMYPPLLTAPENNQIVCPGESALLTINANGGFGGTYNYQWTDGNGNSVGNTNPILVTPNSAPMTYTVTISDNCETPGITNSITVDWHPNPVPTFTTDIVDGCFPITVNFVNTTSPDLSAACLWNFGNGATSNDCDNNSITFATAGQFTVTLQTTSNEGCIGQTTLNNYITTYGYPSAEFTWSPDTLTIFNSETSFENLSSPNSTSFQWFFYDSNLISTSSELNPSLIFPGQDPATFLATLVATTINGCTDTISHYIVRQGIYSFYVPNAFSPNNDGVNDSFFPSGEGISDKNFSMYIFDRWGNLIFETNEHTKSWDGKHNGELVPIGNYVWRISTKDIFDDDKHIYLGHVTVVY